MANIFISSLMRSLLLRSTEIKNGGTVRGHSASQSTVTLTFIVGGLSLSFSGFPEQERQGNKSLHTPTCHYAIYLHINIDDIVLVEVETHGGGLGSYGSGLSHGLKDLGTAGRRDHHIEGSWSQWTSSKLVQQWHTKLLHQSSTP